MTAAAALGRPDVRAQSESRKAPGLIIVTLPGEPQGKGRPRFGQGRAFTPAKTRSYEAAFALTARAAMAGKTPFDDAVSVRVDAYFAIPKSWSKAKQDAARRGAIRPTKKPDADNVFKMVDGLNGIVWRDDALIVDAAIAKHFSDEPRLVVTVAAAQGEG